MSVYQKSIKCSIHFPTGIQHKYKYPGGKSSPEIYKEYEWTFDKKGNDDCKHKRDKQYGSYFTGPRFIDEFMMCMNMKLPTTYSVTFERKLFRQAVNWDKPIFEQEDPPKTGLWTAYTSPCGGDSGSPQMMFVLNQKDPKFVLGAIFSRALGYFGLQRTDGGPIYAAPCGTNTENTEKSHNDEEDILRKIGESVKITYGPLFQWIRTKKLIRAVPVP